MNSPQLVKDIGEAGLLKRLQSFCPIEVVGDDGAVLNIERDRQLVVTTDVLVDGVHFSDRTTSAFDVGWRSGTANLSDLAAMGATPLGITVGLSLPGETPVSWVEELYRGLFECLNKYKTPIVGGDITRSSVITIAITALGEVRSDRVIQRSNARVGDAIVISDYHGLSKAGLELLLNPKLGNNLSDREKEFLSLAHQQPVPRLDLLPILETIAPTIAIGGMDSSDGLADAISQICRFSGVGAVVWEWALPIYPALEKMVGKSIALEWILYGGEDFQLVLSLPKSVAMDLVDRQSNIAIVGEIRLQPEIILVKDRELNSVSLLSPSFQHF